MGIAPYGGCGGAVRGRAAAHMGAALQGVTGGAVQVGGVEPRPYAGQGMRCGGRTDCRVAVLLAMTVFGVVWCVVGRRGVVTPPYG